MSRGEPHGHGLCFGYAQPVGTIWFGLARKGERTITKHRKLPWGRDRVQTLSAYVALELVRRAALGRNFDLGER